MQKLKHENDIGLMIKMKTNRRAFTMTEIAVAVTVFTMVFIGLSLLTTSSRKETSRSINYLRALELAQEAIDWVDSAPFSEVTDANLEFLKGTLVDPATNNSISITPSTNDKNSIESFVYPEDYTKCYYYRTAEIEDLGNRFIKKVKIGVYWNEGSVPKNIETTSNEPDRMRKLFLSTIIFDEKAYY